MKVVSKRLRKALHPQVGVTLPPSPRRAAPLSRPGCPVEGDGPRHPVATPGEHGDDDEGDQSMHPALSLKRALVFTREEVGKGQSWTDRSGSSDTDR